jgi:hypothetical protein
MESLIARCAIEKIQAHTECTVWEAYVLPRRYYTAVLACFTAAPNAWCRINISNGAVFILHTGMTEEQARSMVCALGEYYVR